MLAAIGQVQLQQDEQPERRDELRVALAHLRLNLANAHGRLRRGSEAHAILDGVDRDLDPERMPQLPPEQGQEWLLAWADAADARGAQHARDGDTAAAEGRLHAGLQRSERLR
jgi:hypothetical protein